MQTAREVPLWLVAGVAAPVEREDAMRALGVDVLKVKERAGRLDLASVLTMLAGRGITRLMVEGGPTLAAALLERRSRGCGRLAAFAHRHWTRWNQRP